MYLLLLGLLLFQLVEFGFSCGSHLVRLIANIKLLLLTECVLCDCLAFALC